MSKFIPKWHKELEIFSRVKPLIMLEGNVLDSYQYPVDGSIAKGSILRLPEYLHYFFKDQGYSNIVFYDSLRGFYNTYEDGYINSFAETVNAAVDNNFINAQFKSTGRNSAAEYVRTAMSQTSAATVIVMNFASRYIVSPDNLNQSEVDSYTVMLQSSMESKDVRTPNGILKNILVLIVNKTNDIPAWFYLDNPNEKTITLSTPSKEERENLIKGDNFISFFAGDIYVNESPYYEEHQDELVKIQDKFIALTDGFSFTEINGLRRLCKNERISMRNMCDVIDLYKYGIRENPWNNLDMDALRNAHEDFVKRVKGQDYAITKTLDVVKRAVTGMSGLQGSSHSRPKGVCVKMR